MSIFRVYPVSPKGGNSSIAFLCVCFFLVLFSRARRRKSPFQVWSDFSFNGEGSGVLSKLTFPSQRVHITIKCDFEVDSSSLKKDRMAEGERFLESGLFGQKEW